MQSKLVDYIEKILVENTSIDMWSDVYLPSIQDLYEEQYDRSVFVYFMDKIDEYSDENKVCVLEIILSFNDPSNFYPVLEKFVHTKNEEVIETIIAYTRFWTLTENQKQILNDFYANSEAQSLFADRMLDDFNKKR